MKLRISSLIVIILILVISGCSAMSAMQQPVKINPASFQPPANRTTIAMILGAPLVSEVKDGVLSETFKFTEGYGGGSKARVIPYIAACVFTLCLSELILWPIEELAVTGNERAYMVTYDEHGNSVHGRLFSDKGLIQEYHHDTAAVTSDQVHLFRK